MTGTQGHYISAADVDGDGDDDLIASTHAENTVSIYYANACDGPPREECCAVGERWDETRCVACDPASYGAARGVCQPCPDACAVPGCAAAKDGSRRRRGYSVDGLS